jgi:hypothetical protein
VRLVRGTQAVEIPLSREHLEQGVLLRRLPTRDTSRGW